MVVSGRRVEIAADDAAGLGVATNLETRSISAKAAMRNIRTGQDILTTAEGGAQEITDLLQRMRELAVASASETLDDDERAYLGDEYDALLEEVDRITGVTTWDNRPLLTSARVDLIVALLATGGAVNVAALDTILTNMETSLEADGYDVAFGLAFLGNGGAGDAIDSVEAYTQLEDTTFSADLAALGGAGTSAVNPWIAVGQVIGAGTFGSDVTAGVDADEIAWRNGAQSRNIVTVQTADPTGSASFGTFGAGPGNLASATTVSAYATAESIEIHRLGGTSNGGMAAGTGAIRISGAASASNMQAFADAFALDVRDDILPGIGAVHVGPGDTSNDRITLLPIGDLSTTGMQISNTSIDSQSDALDALEALDDALDDVNAYRAGLGAKFNRLDHAHEALWGHTLALDTAEQTIMDADYAVLASEMVMEQFFVDAGAAALTQAAQMESSTVAALLG